MKEMIYGPKMMFKVLDKGTYRDIPYWIVSRGTHPCCYLELSKYLADHGINSIGKDAEDLEIDCHGDLSYASDHIDGIWDKKKKGFEPGKKVFVGWHYKHCGDYCGEPLFNEIINKHTSEYKWSTKELIHDAKRSIDSLFPYESKYGLKQMKYVGKHFREVLGSGILKGIPWWIVSYGSHPCVYLEVTGLNDLQIGEICGASHEWVSFDKDHLSEVWDQETPGFKPNARRFIGWDYAHADIDYFNDYPAPGTLASAFMDVVHLPLGALKREGHRWSSDELYEEIKNAIDKATSV